MVIKITETQLRVLENYLNNNILTEVGPGKGVGKGKGKGKGTSSSTSTSGGKTKTINPITSKPSTKVPTTRVASTLSKADLINDLGMAFDSAIKKWQIPSSLVPHKKTVVADAFEKAGGTDYKKMIEKMGKVLDELAEQNNLAKNPEVKSFIGHTRDWLGKTSKEKFVSFGKLISGLIIIGLAETMGEMYFRDNWRDVTLIQSKFPERQLEREVEPIKKSLLKLLKQSGSEFTIDNEPTKINEDDVVYNRSKDFTIKIEKSGDNYEIYINPVAQIDGNEYSNLSYINNKFIYEKPSGVTIKELLTTIGSEVKLGDGSVQITSDDIIFNKNIKQINVVNKKVTIKSGAKIGGVFYNNFIWDKTNEILTALKTLNLDNFKLYLKNLWQNDYTGSEKITVKDNNITVDDGVKTFYFNFNDGNFTCLNCKE